MGIDGGSPRNGPQISKFAMDYDRRRLHDALTEAMREHEPDVPCLNQSGPYAPDWGAEDPRLQREAARLCRGCPVLAECRAYGVSAHLEQGVFGGLTRGQRSKAHTEQVRAEAAAAAAATEQDAAAAAAAAAQAETANGQQQRTGTNGRGTVIELNGRNGAQRTEQTARRAANGQYTTASRQRRTANR